MNSSSKSAVQLCSSQLNRLTQWETGTNKCVALCVIEREPCLADRKTTRWRLYIGSLRFILPEVNTWTARYLSCPQETHCLTEASIMIGRFRALMGVNL